MQSPWRRFRISTRCGMGCFFCLLGMKNAACCSGLFHPHICFDGAKISNIIQTCKQMVILLRFIFISKSFTVLCYPLAQSVVLTLLVCLLAMTPLFGMGLDMTWDAQQLDVVRVVTQALHLGQRLAALHRHDVMAVHAWGDVPFGLAPLAQPSGPGPHEGLHLRPLRGVQ